MKVLWFTNTPANAVEYLNDGPVGGGWLKALDKALQKRIELHVAFYYPKNLGYFKYLDTIYHPIRVENWKLKTVVRMFLTNFLDRNDLPEYLRIIELVKPDIVHIHGTENAFGSILGHINAPVVISIQGCMTVYSHKFLSGFTQRDLLLNSISIPNSFKHFLRHKSYRRTFKELRKMSLVERQILRKARYVFGRTQWDYRITSVLAPNRVYYSCDEVMRDTFYHTIWEYHGREKLVIHSTNGNNLYKGFETLCETLFELNCVSGLKIEWQVAGINPNDDIVKITRKKLRNRFPTSGLKLTGCLEEKELAEIMCNADIYVSPSHIENSPNTLCEAMLLGMPCIATFAGGTGSILKDGEEGILIQDGDPWALAGAILELFRSPEQAVNFGKKARERAMVRHNPERIVSDLIYNYSQIITTHATSLTHNK